jgi:hypothetical protein
LANKLTPLAAANDAIAGYQRRANDRLAIVVQNVEPTAWHRIHTLELERLSR